MNRLALSLVLSVVTVAFGAPAAQAHTGVRETSIADNTQLSAAPPNFTVTFSASTRLANVALTNTAGEEIDLNYSPPREYATTFVIPLPRLTPGRYTLAWRTLARDGHVMTGSVHFTIAG